MKKIATLLLVLNLLSLSGFASAADSGPIQEIPLSYLEATEAYQSLKNAYPEIADIVTSLQIDKNSVSIHRDHPKAASFLKALAELDQRPQQVLLSVVVTEVTKSTGKERVLSRPAVFTMDRKPATISLPSSSADKELNITITITITPRSIPSVAKK